MNNLYLQNDHIPVLLNEALSFLPNKKNLNVIDATFGGGSYSYSILKKSNVSRLVSIDRDTKVINFKKNNYSKKNFELIEGKFSKIDLLVKDYMNSNNLKGFHAIFFDLGLSSNQLNDISKGFSFKRNGPLDMRMDISGISAHEIINNFSEKDLANIIFKYGEENFAKSIARKIVEYRKKQLIQTTFELKSIIKKSIKINKKNLKKDLSTKTFQALRIFVNNELDEIDKALNKSINLLVPGGRIIIVSFHSLEDRLVKEFFNHNSGKKWRSSRHYPEPSESGPISLKIITKKAIRPNENEIYTNPRSRSARLRVAEKIMSNSREI